jgi:catechol 2,3-dioxygenase-like lactoylglutathione lyase family enzyme/heme-degrading monooxygenase HmoA
MHRNYLRTLCDHLDVRVRDTKNARLFYDPLCAALGLNVVGVGKEWVAYETADSSDAFLAITSDPDFSPSRTRIAFRADSREDVERIARVAHAAGAAEFEPAQACPEYAEGYYAAFFADPDGNRYEICFRPLAPTIGRLWRGRVRPQLLQEYREYVTATGLRDYATTQGNRGAAMLTRQADGHADIITLSLWESRQAIERFAGMPIDRARYYPEDDRYLLDRPPHVEHFDVTF